MGSERNASSATLHAGAAAASSSAGAGAAAFEECGAACFPQMGHIADIAVRYSMARLRRVAAVVLAFVGPLGIGHLVLGHRLRGIVWLVGPMLLLLAFGGQ